MVFFTKDMWVWMDHPKEAWIPVQLLSQKGDVIVAKSQSGEQFELNAKLDMGAVNVSALTPVENMVNMEELSEAAILHNLRMRYEQDLIYTYISSILVSVNPYKQLPIYSPAVMQEYRRKMAEHQNTAPHVYALSDNCYKALTFDGHSQAVIISGESGAGKTEATKLVLQYMAEMSGQGSDVEQQLLEANPIIEAFGNAKTVRNDNSSRFGKWIEIVFDKKFHIQGAQITNYLLEKSRIIDPGPGERNYHFFYQLLSGMSKEQKTKYKLSQASNYRILSAGKCWDVASINDSEDFMRVRRAMDVLRFSAQEQQNLCQTVACVLHLGNVDFNAKGDQAEVKDKAVLGDVAALLEVTPAQLEAALMSQYRTMGKERLLTYLNKAQSEANRDALAKAVYGNMFNWLIERINRAMHTDTAHHHTVGVLDIFGFEIFDQNRFEQFCINYANEKMQQHFNEHIFTMEQAEYKADGIDVAHVSFVDNQPCLDLIESSKQGILSMVDEEIRIPKGGDLNLLKRLHDQHKKSKYYVPPKGSAPMFSIAHYAGLVEYQVDGFTEKNKDTLQEDLANALRSSKNPFMAGLMPNVLKQTVGSQFKNQLSSLMEALRLCSPHFIRCIKSNAEKVSDTFDAMFILRQLRYLGLKEVVNIRQLGYPVRRTHKDFFGRYQTLAPTVKRKENDMKGCCEEMCKFFDGLLSKEVIPHEWKVGKTKVFYRNSLQSKLEAFRERKITKLVITIQKLCRGRLWRHRYKLMKQVEGKLRVAMKGESVEALDAAIASYENVQFKINRKLVQEAIALRNRLYEQQQARRALDIALKALDVHLLAAAIKGGIKAKVEQSLVDAAQALLSRLNLYYQHLEKALASRDLALVTAVVHTAQELGLKGGKEREAEALKKALEEEEAVKAKLAAAMKARDLEQLKNALQVAMTYKSSAMVNAGLQRAMAAGLANDPLVQEALKLENHLEKEVSKARMAAELETAIKTGDYQMLEATVKMAADFEKEKDAKISGLTVQAKELMATIIRGREALAGLTAAIASKDIDQLEKAIMVGAKENKQASGEYIEASRLRAELIDLRTKLLEAKRQAEERERQRKIQEERERQLERERQARVAAELAAAKAAAEERERQMAEAAARAREEELQRQARAAAELAAAAQIAAAEERERALAAAAARAREEQLESEKRQAEEARKAREEHERALAVTRALQEQQAREAREAEEKSRREREEIERKEADEVAENIARAAALGMKGAEIIEARKIRDSMEAKEGLITALESAMRARDVNLLKEAIHNATSPLPDRTSLPPQHQAVVDAAELLAELEREQNMMAQELRQAEQAVEEQAAEEAGQPTPVQRQTVYTPQPTDNTGVAKFDELRYRQDMFELGAYSELRTANNFVKNKLWNKKAAKISMLSHFREALPTSLTKLRDDPKLVAKATELFKSVQGFMLDRHYSFPDSLVSELVEECVRTPLIRNEIYIQVMKQVMGNPVPESEERGWMLLCLMAEVFPPSDGFLYFLLHFLDLHMRGMFASSATNPQASQIALQSQRQAIMNYASYCFHTLEFTVGRFQTQGEPRKTDAKKAFTPVAHVTAFRDRDMVPREVTIAFPDASEVRVQVAPWINCKRLIPMICDMIELRDTFGVALFELRGNTASYVFEDECLLDFMSRWTVRAKRVVEKKSGFFSRLLSKRNLLQVEKKEDEEEKVAGAEDDAGVPPPGSEEEIPGVRRFLIARRVFPKSLEMEDPVMNTIMFAQCCRGMCEGNFDIDPRSAATMAAIVKRLVETNKVPLIGQQKCTKPFDSDETDPFLEINLWGCPPNLLSEKRKKIPDKDWAKMVREREGDEIVANASIVTYIQLIKQLPTFGCQFFPVSQNYDQTFPSRLVLAANFSGVFLQDAVTKAQITHFPLMSVLAWSNTPLLVLLKVKLSQKTAAGKSAATLRFRTLTARSGKEVCDLMLKYADEMMKYIKLQQASMKGKPVGEG